MHVVLVDVQADQRPVLQVLGRPGVTWFGMAFFVKDYHVQGHIGIKTIIDYLKDSNTMGLIMIWMNIYFNLTLIIFVPNSLIS